MSARLRTAFRIALVALTLAAFGLVLWSGALERLSLDGLRDYRAGLLAHVHAHPWLSVGIYIAVFAVVVVLSLPGALVMTLSGGFLFGALEGGAAAVVGVWLGCMAMVLIARTAVGDGARAWLAARSGIVRRVEAEVSRHPFTTLLTLRLIPAAPIALVNLAAGFVRAPLPAYALATLIGVTPSSFLYASVGSGLGRLFQTERPGHVMEAVRQALFWPVLGVLGLAVLPIALRWWSLRRVAARLRVQ